VLDIRLLMNSPADDVLSFRTCCSIRAWDQNLEIHVRNLADRDIRIPSFCDIDGVYGRRRIETLMPAGVIVLHPGELKAFYCYMDEEMWAKSHRLTIYDTDGASYPIPTGVVPS
jgi:hypothetical protein